MARKQHQETELVTVRVPKDVLALLRLACQATGSTMSDEIRLGIQMRVNEIRDDKVVRQKVQERIVQLQSLYAELDANVPANEPEPAEPVGAAQTESA